ncbi:MAG: quinon protein alcohol dehydrogenase-like superfamily [Monoraphidium minutum]|nr:MAG: quinon protein alcohol dehydrogenase-like superfamily [Monoraphidium minutum]
MPGGRAKRGRAPRGDAAAAGAAAAAAADADADADAAPPGGMTALHRWRSPPWAVSTVAALAACPDGSAVAAAYEDGRVEVWHLSYLCRLMAVPGWEGADLSSLAWAHDVVARRWRLFAGSLDGAVYEVDFERQALAHASDSYGGAVWALVAAPPAPAGGASAGGGAGHELVAACDDGSLRVLRVHGGVAGCEYVRALAKAEGRTLAAAWHPDGGAVVSGGSDGCIHAWDYATGRELMRITAAVRSASPPCIWALTVLPDGTVVSGDSEGATAFWEGRFGTLLSRLQQHAAGVMAVAASADGSMVFSAGVDPRVAVFRRVDDAASGATRWAYLAHKSPHTHEVRALAAAPRGGGADELLLSGGADGQLVLYPALRVLQEHPVRLTKAPQAPLLQLAPSAPGGAPRLLVAQRRTLSLWRLGRAAPGAAAPLAAAPLAAAEGGPRGGGAAPDHSDQGAEEGDPLDLSEGPSCLAELRLRGPRHAACAAAAPDGRRVAVSSAAGVRLFEIEDAPGGGAAVRRVAPHRPDAGGSDDEGEDGGGGGAPPPPAVCMEFAADGGALFCADAAGVPAVSALVASPDGRWLAAACGGGVRLLELTAAGGLAPAGPLLLLGDASARDAPPVTALAWSPDSSLVAVATAADAVAAYSVATRAPTPWSATNRRALSKLLRLLPGTVEGLSFEPGGGAGGGEGGEAPPLSVLVRSAGGVCHVDLLAPLSAARALDGKRRRGPAKPRPGERASVAGLNGRVLPLESPCLFLGFTGRAAAVLVEKPWEDVLAALPPPLLRHRYGT